MNFLRDRRDDWKAATWGERALFLFMAAILLAFIASLAALSCALWYEYHAARVAGAVVGKGSSAAHTGIATGTGVSGNGQVTVVFVPQEEPDRYWLHVRDDRGGVWRVRVPGAVWATVHEGDYWNPGKR